MALGGLAIGLQGAGALAGALTGGLAGRKDERFNRRLSRGAEDPAVAALRRRLAAQNAATAMSVAASQPGVNPALAQRNAQQALGAQQAQTNTMLAQENMQSARVARQAAQASRLRRMTAAGMGGAQFLNTLGTGFGVQEAQAQQHQRNLELMQARQGLAKPGDKPAGQPQDLTDKQLQMGVPGVAGQFAQQAPAVSPFGGVQSQQQAVQAGVSPQGTGMTNQLQPTQPENMEAVDFDTNLVGHDELAQIAAIQDPTEQIMALSTLQQQAILAGQTERAAELNRIRLNLTGATHLQRMQ